MKKTYITIVALLCLVACQKPVNYLEQGQNFFKAEEKMELTASSTKIDLDREKPDDVALTFEWTSAREMPDDYIPTYITKIDIAGNNFNTCVRTVEDDGVFSKSFTNAQLQSYILDKWGKSYVRPVTLQFGVLCKWDGGDRYIMPEVRTLNVEVRPFRPLTFDVDKLYISGDAVMGATRIQMKQTPENEFQYAAHVPLKAGTLTLPVVYDGETTYIVPSDLDGSTLMDGEDEPVTMRTDAQGWTIPSEGTYRIIVNIQNKTVRIHSPATDLFPKTFSGHFGPVGAYNEDVEFTLDPAGNVNGTPWLFGFKGDNMDGSGWLTKEVKFEFSEADPQLLVYSGADVKGDKCIALINWLTSDGKPYTNYDSAFYIVPKKSEIGTYQVNKNTWYDIAYGFLRDPNLEVDGVPIGANLRGIKFLFRNDQNASTPVNFIMIDFRNDRIYFDKK